MQKTRKSRSTLPAGRAQSGIALLISIFILLLISVVAIALIVSSGTESALAGNYRSSTGVYYAAMTGLEEARSRLMSRGSSAFSTTNPISFLPSTGTPLSMGNTYYLINPVSGETIAPWDSSSPYADTQFSKEYSASGFSSPSNPSPTALSIWNRSDLGLNPGNYPGATYKWVRINAVSEKSLGVDADNDGQADSTSPLYYDGAHFSNNAAVGLPQVFELTAFAVLPNGSQKILQYVVAPSPLGIPSYLNSAPQSALTISGSPGNSPTFQAPLNNASYSVQGNDNLGGCSGSTGSSVAAIGLFGDYSGSNPSSDIAGIKAGIPTAVGGPPPVNTQLNYTGQGSPADVEYLSSIPSSQETPAQVDAIAQNLLRNADAVVLTPTPASTPPYLGTVNASALHTAASAAGMSSANPITLAVNGNLDLSNFNGQGYGLLLVTGTLTYDPDTTWNGIILVIGQGIVNNTQHGGSQQLNGAMFVAKTRDGNGNLLTGRIGNGTVSFDSGMQGNGIRYSSCWIGRTQPFSDYKIIAFHEIPTQ